MDDLCSRLSVHSAAREWGAPFQHTVQRDGAFGAQRLVEERPIANPREARLREIRAKSPDEPSGTGTVQGPDFVETSVLGGDPGRNLCRVARTQDLLLE